MTLMAQYVCEIGAYTVVINHVIQSRPFRLGVLLLSPLVI